MINPVITARPIGEGTAYVPLDTQFLSASVSCRQGAGSQEDPWQICITVTNTGDELWQGVIRISLPIEAAALRFFLPGFMYGTNRGETPLVVDSKCPRLRENEDFPASSWWMIRSDRLSHPAAFAFGNRRLIGLSAAPYYVLCNGRRLPWQPGTMGEFDQYTGFGCSLRLGELIYTLGYENAPWLFVDAHQYTPRAPLRENCFALQNGETVVVCLYSFDYPAEDERGIHGALGWVYRHYHQAPRCLCDVRKTVCDMAWAISRDAWLPEQHSYAGFVFDRGDHFEYSSLPSIAWTNGMAVAGPMLQAAIRLGCDDMRQQAVECIDYIVRYSINEHSGLPYMAEHSGVWSNRGWWYERLRTPGHAAYLVGQCVYQILKAYTWEKNEYGVCHEDWLAYARRILMRTERSRNSDEEYPYVFSEKTGAGLEYDSFSGAWCMAAAAYYSYLTGDRTYLPGLLRSEQYYHDAYIRHQECYGGPLDIDKNVDSEGILAYIRAVRYLHAMTGDEMLLSHMRDAFLYEFTFKFCYNSPVKIPPLSTVGWSSCGGSITSVTNPHIHPMSSSVMDEMLYYLTQCNDTYVRSRMQDTLLWSCQCHATFDGEYGYGKKGWMSERFCHSQGLIKERYPDGTPASTWFALMPWACGAILEGLTGEAWSLRKFEIYEEKATEKISSCDGSVKISGHSHGRD